MQSNLNTPASPADQADAPPTATLTPEGVVAFAKALHGRRGELDGWLECSTEAEVRAHIRAYAASSNNAPGPLFPPLRERAAIAAMQGILGNSNLSPVFIRGNAVAAAAVINADELIAALAAVRGES